MTADRAAALAAAIAAGKYRYLAPDVIAAFAGRAASRHKQDGDAVNWARRKLHEAYGAFLDARGLERAASLARALPAAAPVAQLQEPCRAILGGHASTRERLAHMETFYGRIFAKTGHPRTIADLACGLHPFAWPWMGLPRTVRWLTLDVDRRIAGMISDFLHRQAMPGHGTAGDILTSPLPEADVTFLLKTLPLLDRQAPDGGEAALRRIRSAWLVVSFPTRSLGGRDVGMAAAHARRWEPVLARLGRSGEVFEIPGERVHLLRRDDAP